MWQYDNPAGGPPSVSVAEGSKALQVWWYGQGASLPEPQLGFCGFPGRTWRLWASRYSQEYSKKSPALRAPSHRLGYSSSPP